MHPRAVSVAVAGDWPADQAQATITLEYEARHRRRFLLETDEGMPFLLDLPQATQLQDGDALVLETGGWVRVNAAIEAVVDVTGRDPLHTARLAWHIGNRHVPLQVLNNGALRIRDDHVIIEMVERLGAQVNRHQAPLSPESGAYDSHGH